jgi:hypothetical protein
VGSASYELLDQYPDPSGSNGELHFGVVRRDFTPKPVMYPIQRLLGYLNDTGYTASHLDAQVRVTSPPGVPIRVAAVQRLDNTLYIFVWRPVAYASLQPQPISVSVRMPGWPWGMYLNQERLDTPGSWVGSGPTIPPDADGWRTWSGYGLDQHMMMFREWH